MTTYSLDGVELRTVALPPHLARDKAGGSITSRTGLCLSELLVSW
jgi:hypothetical protein